MFSDFLSVRKQDRWAGRTYVSLRLFLSPAFLLFQRIPPIYFAASWESLL